MIRSKASVLFDATSELREDHHGDFVRVPDASEVLDEAADGVGRIHQQAAVQIRLLHVRIERVALIRHVVQPRRHPRGDERRDAPEVAAEAAALAVVHRRLIGGCRLPNEVGAVGGVLGRRLQKFQRRVRRRHRVAQPREHSLLFVITLTTEARRIVEDER